MTSSATMRPSTRSLSGSTTSPPSTIGVIVTTLIVGVMKVYDIVKVSTNGQFGTQVLANQMFQEAFSFQDFGKGSALAMLIFLSVLPVMIINIRRMQREG